jgi:hypothetical protein
VSSFPPVHLMRQVTGEATPSYMAGFYTAERMAAMVPTARVVVVLRDPVERFYSEYARACDSRSR